MVVLFSGCATQPRTDGAAVDDESETISGPSTLIAGARVEDVRSVAMGSARSKGWTVVSASNQKLVLRRPVSPDAPQAIEVGSGADGVPPSVEVTTMFRQAPGGVNVTVNAQLVTRAQVQGEDAKGPVEQRTDYTESYRDNLLYSLEALRSTWAAHHQRVARALPPIGAAGQAAAATAAELKGDQPGTTEAQDEAPLQSPLPPEATPTAWGAPLEDEPEPTVPAEPPTAARVAPVAAAVQTTTAPGSQTAAAPAGTFPTPVRTQGAQAQPYAGAATVSSADNMLVLDRGPPARSEVGNAEQYAALRGCDVRSGRTALVKRDGSSEFLRVYCTGDPAFLVKCTDGVCKGLE
jgi:hypothetical protein